MIGVNDSHGSVSQACACKTGFNDFYGFRMVDDGEIFTGSGWEYTEHLFQIVQIFTQTNELKWFIFSY